MSLYYIATLTRPHEIPRLSNEVNGQRNLHFSVEHPLVISDSCDSKLMLQVASGPRFGISRLGGLRLRVRAQPLPPPSLVPNYDIT